MAQLLMYGDIEIARVQQVDSDFPNLWASFELTADFLANESRPALRLKQWVELSFREAELLDREHEEDVSQGYRDLEDEQAGFLDLVESRDWGLVDVETGKRQPILLPLLRRDGEIVYRWNFL